MRHRLSASAVALASLLAIATATACGSGDGDPSPTPQDSPTSPATTTGTAGTATPTPPAAIDSTGIEAIDAFLAAREDGDAAALTALLRTHKALCGGGEYSLSCPAGVSPGTLVDAFPWGGCHGAWSNQGTLEQAGAFIAGRQGELRLVIRFTPMDQLERLPPTVTTAAIFEEQMYGATYAWAIIVDETNVYGWLTGCGVDTPALLKYVFPGSEVILAAP